MATERPVTIRDVNGMPKSLQTVLFTWWTEKGGFEITSTKKELTRLLFNVNIERSLGAVQVVMSAEDTVRDLVKAAVRIYVKEKRRPLLKETHPDRLELHFSQFSFECLKPDEKLMHLGSRNFFLCLKPSNSSASSYCSEEANITINSTLALTKLMDFLL